MSNEKQPRNVLNVLFTSDDVGHIHKILGFSCLFSFGYRYYHFGEADCNFGPNPGTLLFVLHHLLLNLSSFIFSLPEKRIVSGYRLWPEARLHALIFVLRSLAFMTVYYYQDVHYHHQVQAPRQQQMLQPRSLPLWVNLVIVLGTCAAADLVSSRQPYSSRTIRDLEFPPLWKWFFGTVQFVATALCLVGPGRRYTYHLSFVFVIQVNAFLMTLRRKNIASHTTLVYAYAGLLLWGLAVTVLDDQYSQCVHSSATLGIGTAMVRFHWNINKYILWTMVGLLVHCIRDSSGFWKTNVWWIGAHVVSFAAAMALGYRKMIRTDESNVRKSKKVSKSL